MQFGLGNSTRMLYFFFDVILVALVLGIVLKLFNTRRALGYIGVIGVTVIVLAATAVLTLPGLHVLSKAILTLLIVGLPLYLDEHWLNLFGDKNVPAGQTSWLGIPTLVIISIAGAFLIVGASNGISTRTAELPQGITLSAVNLPDGMSASFGSQTKVAAIVTASRDKWQSLTADNFSANVDVAEQGEGTYDLTVNVTSKVDGVTIVRTKPSRVVVTVEPLIRKTVFVTPRYTGKAGEELVPDEAVMTPNKVESEGPKSVVTDLTQGVIQVQLNGETDAIKQKYSIVALNSSGEVIPSVTFDPAEVEASIPLVKAGKIKTLGIRPVLSGQPASGFWVKTITADPSVVSVTGPADVLTELKEISTEAVSVAGLNSTTTLQAVMALPNGITVADKTGKISLKIEIDQVPTTKSINPEFVYDGLSSSLKVSSTNPTSISVLVSGPSNQLSSLGSSDVKLKLNLGPFQSAGTYSVAIKNSDFVLPEGVSLVSFLPSAVSVTLENR